MFLDGNGMPLGGGLALAAIAYAALSLFATGPLIGDRIIERSNWPEQCRAELNAQIIEQAPSPEFRPRLDCNAFLGMFGAEGRQVCQHYGNPEFKLPMQDQLEAHERRLRQAQARRLEARIARSGSRCGCAATVVLDEARVGFAIYAGSARLVTPPAVDDLDASLMSALRSPRCERD